MLMATLADFIERYLKTQLAANDDPVLEIRRNQLASDFDCAPSQITYVLETRFTLERGYVVESRRGGGGYIRIVRLSSDNEEKLLDKIRREIGKYLSESEALDYLDRLHQEEFISRRERALMESVMDRNAIALELPRRDRVRARLLKNMLLALLKHDEQT